MKKKRNTYYPPPPVLDKGNISFIPNPPQKNISPYNPLTPRFTNRKNLEQSDPFFKETVKLIDFSKPLDPRKTEKTEDKLSPSAVELGSPPSTFIKSKQDNLTLRQIKTKTEFINMMINNFPVKCHLFQGNIVNPRELKGFYGDMDEIVGKLSYMGGGYLSNEVQILKFKNTSMKNMVLKRCVMDCTLESIEKIKKQTKSREMTFISSCFEEYYISKIVSSHPAGLASIDFQISLLTQCGLLVTEFLMEDGGIELGVFCQNEVDNFSYDKKILDFMNESADVLRFMQRMKLKYGDLKSQNFLVEPNGKLKIIDFNISQIGGLGRSTGAIIKKEIRGYTHGYMSPEIYNVVNNLSPGSEFRKSCEGIDCWLSDIYSWGILFLLLLKGVKNEAELAELDACKNNKKEHKKIVNRIENIQINDFQIKQKVIFILKKCLKFDPKKRINLKLLDEIMKNIENYSLDIIKEKIKKNILLPESKHE